LWQRTDKKLKKNKFWAYQPSLSPPLKIDALLGQAIVACAKPKPSKALTMGLNQEFYL
jgi:hypothetical protein